MELNGLVYDMIKDLLPEGMEETYKGKRTDNGAPGTFKAKITKAYGGDVTIEKARKFKSRENATPLDKQQANWFINFHSKNEGLNEVGEANLKPYKWEEIDRESYFIYTRFVTDSETEYDVDLKSTNYIDDNLKNLRTIEIEFSAKPKGAEGGSAKILVNKGELYKVMATVIDIVKNYIKKSKAQAIIYSPSKKSNEENFGVQRDNLYKAFISKAFPGTKFEKIGNLILATLPDNTVANESMDPQSGKAAPYGSGYTPVQEVLVGYIQELSNYMKEEGLNIEPAPAVKMEDDEENAKDPLGKTAYYDPNNKVIVLYITGRHLKDILRSFAHEMIHHNQNLEDRLGKIETTDINEDDSLKEIEREAYEKGNLYFRGWENSRKNKV